MWVWLALVAGASEPHPLGVELTERCAANDMASCERLLERDVAILGAWAARGESAPAWRRTAFSTHLWQVLVLHHEAGAIELPSAVVDELCRFGDRSTCARLRPRPREVEAPPGTRSSIEGWVGPRGGADVWLIEQRRGSSRSPSTWKMLAETSRAVAHAVADAEGRFRFDDVPMDRSLELLAVDREGRAWTEVDAFESPVLELRTGSEAIRSVQVQEATGGSAASGWLQVGGLLLPLDGEAHWVPVPASPPELFAWGPAGRSEPIGTLARGPVVLTQLEGSEVSCELRFRSGARGGLFDGPCLDVPQAPGASLRGAGWRSAGGDRVEVTLRNQPRFELVDGRRISRYRLERGDGTPVPADEPLDGGTYGFVGLRTWSEDEEPAMHRVRATVHVPEGSPVVTLVGAELEDVPRPRVVDSEGYPVPSAVVWARSDLTPSRGARRSVASLPYSAGVDGRVALPPFADGHVEARVEGGPGGEMVRLQLGEAPELPVPVPELPWSEVGGALPSHVVAVGGVGVSFVGNDVRVVLPVASEAVHASWRGRDAWIQ